MPDRTDFAAAWNERGHILAGSGRTDEAIAAFRAAVAHDPAFGIARRNLGRLLIDVGKFDEAQVQLERALAINRDDAGAYLSLVSLGGGRLEPPAQAGLMQLSARRQTLARDARIDLHFALAGVHERAGRVLEAFAELAAGNAAKRSTIAYDEAAQLRFAAATQATFGHPITAKLFGGNSDASARPVLIVGMPRSGSTLVEAILAAHPAVRSAGEIGVLGGIVREHWPTAAGSIAELRAGILDIGERYMRTIDTVAPRGTLVTDKTLYNFHFAPLIAAALPGARIVHTMRDALDTCFSCFGTIFSGEQVPFSYDLAELGRYHRAYAAMMDCWRALLPPDRFLEVQYESLVADLESQARRMIDFCGLPWDGACLAFDRLRRPVRTASNVQVRRPLYASSVGRAQPYVAQLAPLIAAAGITGNGAGAMSL